MSDDIATVCYNAEHRAYVGMGVFWLILFPIGIPVLYIATMMYYRVPQAARCTVRTARLRTLADLAIQRGALGPDVLGAGFNTSSLTEHAAPPALVDALYDAVFGPARADAARRRGEAEARRALRAAAARGGGGGSKRARAAEGGGKAKDGDSPVYAKKYAPKRVRV